MIQSLSAFIRTGSSLFGFSFDLCVVSRSNEPFSEQGSRKEWNGEIGVFAYAVSLKGNTEEKKIIFHIYVLSNSFGYGTAQEVTPHCNIVSLGSIRNAYY